MSYRDEEIARLQVLVCTLRQERDVAREEILKQPKRTRVRWTMPDIEKTSLWTLYFFVFALAFTGMFALWSVITSSTSVTSCYVERAINSDNINLMGYRRWNSDVTMSRHDTVTNAVKAAAEMHCPMMLGK